MGLTGQKRVAMEAFDQIKTVKSASAVWQRAILADRVSHAWLFTGQSAADLLSLAQAFAAALQCTDRPEGTAEACMHCKSCLQASDGNHPDILIWPHEKPKVFSIDEVRAMISDVCIRPFSSQYKVYIVPDAHLMRPDAQNALLKTLEEPPAYAVILLLAQSADAMLETVRSRCQTVELSGSRAEYDPLLYQKGEEILLDLPSWNLSQIRSAIKELEPYKTQSDSLLALFTAWYRDVLYYKSAQDADGLLFPEHIAPIREASLALSFEQIQYMLDSIRHAARRLKANVKFDLTMELLLLAFQNASPA